MLEMPRIFTAIYEYDMDWWIGYCPEVPGANGQGRTKDECRQSLAEAIELILEDRREDAMLSKSDDAETEQIVVG